MQICKSACRLSQIGQIKNRPNKLHVVNLVMPDCQLHTCLPAALHMTSQQVSPWQHNQILPFLPVLWQGGQGPEHPPVAPSVHASTVDQCLQPGSHHQVASPLPSLCMMPSCATAVEYRAVSKSPLSSLFWSDSRFQLRGDLGSITPSAGAWVRPCNTPGRADNFGPQNAVPDLGLNE